MAENSSTYRSEMADGAVSEHVVVPSEWTEIEESRSLAFVYVLIAFLLGLTAVVWLAIYFLL